MQAINKAQKLVIEMRARKEYSVGFDLVCMNVREGQKPFSKEPSGSFR